MRVALCISGQMRTFRTCGPLVVQHIVKPLNADVFIHTWSDSGDTLKSEHWRKGQPRKNRTITHAALREIYDYKLAEIELFSPAMSEELNGQQLAEAIKAMYPDAYPAMLPLNYKIWKCDRLRREWEKLNGFEYDWVIRLRPDFAVYEPLPFDFSELNQECLYWCLWPTLNPSTQVSDKLAFGCSQTMRYYAAGFTRINEYMQDPVGEGTFGSIRFGERFTCYHMNQAPFRRIPFNMRGEIVRFGEE